jgi:GrpB-like predicted nucleotidyltransferase (UPF0157 family)
MSPPAPLELSPYSPLWPAIFEMEREHLLRILDPRSARIEHIGSTAVPGLGAKPIIDVMAGVPDLRLVERCIDALAAEGYRYVPEFEKAIPERRYFAKTGGHLGSFHLHAVVYDTPFWQRHLKFRDALRADATLAADYWKLKLRLAARFPGDRAAYTDAKSSFIRAVIEKHS